jgi:hypothetical protein
MSFLFTSKEAIAERLRGRIQVGGPSIALGQVVVNELLIERVITQVEARVLAALRQLYVTPLRQSHPQLASIVEKLAVAELLPVHDQAEAAADFARLMYKQGSDELNAIASGDVMLQGEIGAIAPASIKPSFTRVGKRDNTGIKW